MRSFSSVLCTAGIASPAVSPMTELTHHDEIGSRSVTELGHVVHEPVGLVGAILGE